jgi:type IV pilus assembly protein PilA
MLSARMQQGFTLIELMIVVAIIGILSAVAIPAYQDYTHRAQVTEGLQLAAPAKTAVAEYYATKVELPTDNAAAGLAASATYVGKNVSAVAVGTNGVITVTYNTAVSATALTLTLTPQVNSGSISWTCGTPAGSSALPKGWLPANCRGA